MQTQAPVCLKSPADRRVFISSVSFQIVHRTLAAMLGSLAALAALAVTGDVSVTSPAAASPPGGSSEWETAQALGVGWSFHCFIDYFHMPPPPGN